MAIDFDAQNEFDEAEPEATSGINTTPLIDVLLVLLVMLIITIPVHLHAVSMELPGVPAAADAPPPPVVTIAITPGNQVLWNGELLADRDALESRLRLAAQLPAQPEIHIRASATSKYDALAAVLTSSQRLGLMKIGVVGLGEYAQSP